MFTSLEQPTYNLDASLLNLKCESRTTIPIFRDKDIVPQELDLLALAKTKRKMIQFVNSVDFDRVWECITMKSKLIDHQKVKL
jgi:hypothetical protein